MSVGEAAGIQVVRPGPNRRTRRLSARPYRPRTPLQVTTLGGRIRTWRIARGMTQSHLAQVADCGKSFISLLESDRSIPSIFTVTLIAEALELRLDYLILGRRPAER